MKIFLTGFMCCGKTTTGIALAKEMNYTFVDMDILMEERCEMTIDEFFTRFGEDKFRQLERETLLYIFKQKQDAIIALGGGTPCFFDNMELCKRNGISVFLDLPNEEILKRCNESKIRRPLLQTTDEQNMPAFIDNLLAKRRPHYLQSDIIYPASALDVRQLALTIAKFRKNTSKPCLN